ncbi:MAG: transposase [Tepidisphaeraceae bacterium]
MHGVASFRSVRRVLQTLHRNCSRKTYARLAQRGTIIAMPNYLRARDPGGTYFFTVVTEGRQRLFDDSFARDLLAAAIRETLEERPVTVRAMVLLPDHFHAVWTLPENDSDYSTRLSVIKRRFATRYLAGGGSEHARSASRIRNRRRGVWQRRFWEHVVRADEFEEIAAYIHFNPVKHGLVRCPHEWPWSTFQDWVADGRLPSDWECTCGTPRSPRAFAAWFDACE